MIVELNGFICPNNIGNKAKSLVDLNRYGFKVPTSFAMDTNIYLDSIKDIKNKINLLLSKITFDNIEIIAKQMNLLLGKIELNEDVIDEVKSHLDDNDNYILRSSVDGIDTSYAYAGLFPTRMKINKNNITDNILECYKALFSYNSLYYMLKNNIDYSNISVAIIIQKEIITNKLGYVTTLDPVNLKTSQIKLTIEEKKQYENYIYDYISECIVEEDSYKLLSKKRVDETFELIKSIQSNLGYPVEIELAYTKNDIYVLQTRELNSILYDNKKSVWKKASMSSKKFIYSLVNDTYKSIVNDYCDELKLNEIKKPFKLLFNSCYFNVLNLSEIVYQFVDYDQYYFNSCFGYDKSFNNKNNLKLRFKRYFNRKNHEFKINSIIDEYPGLISKYQKLYTDYCHQMSKVSAKDIERVWLKLVLDDYKEIEDNYINTKILILIEKNILYKELSKYITIEEFNNLINCEELLCSYKSKFDFNKLVNDINNDEEAYRYWFSSSINKLMDNYEKENMAYFHKEFRHFIDNYGYMSNYEMDLSLNFYVEDVEDVIRKIKKQLANIESLTNNKKERLKIKKELESSIKQKKFLEISSLIERVQELIIIESYLYDFILRFNFIVKRYTKMLAKFYLTKKIIDNENDIWHLGIEDIYNYTEGEFDYSILKSLVEKNKLYYNSYRNIKDISFIGSGEEPTIDYDYNGIGYSCGIIEGKVKMVKSLKDLKYLTEKDILVTKTINNNLLFQLPKIKGIIVSDPNLSTSVKDMLREFKFPCLMIDNCSKKLSDGMYILANCKTGDIKLLKKKR